MRFGEPPTPAPYLNAKDQRRLLGLVLSLSLVVFAVLWAGRSETWHWLIPPDNETAENVTSAESEDDAPPFDPFSAYSPVEQKDRDSANDAPPFQPPPAFQEDSEDPRPDAPPTAPRDRRVPAAGTAASGARIPADWLEDVDDTKLGIRAEEAPSYYRILAHASRLDEEHLQREARRDLLHVNLIRDPQLHRGKLLSIQGTARRILPIDVNENDYGVREAYEVWLTTPDSGIDPWRIVTTQLDPRLPVGEQVAVQVQAKGFFYKQYSYASQGGMHVAPLLLASLVEPPPVIRTIPPGSGLEPYILLLAGIIGSGTILAVMLYTRGDKRFRTRMKEQFPLKDEEAQKLLERLPDEQQEPELFR